MKLSVVATLYQSAPYIQEFYERVSAAARQVAGEDYEIVLVNDGSPDKSLELAVRLSSCDHHVVVVDLSRNFGHHKAMMTGLAYSGGELVFLLDSDLEEEPEWLPAFAWHMEQDSCDVVYGVQEQRKGNWFECWSGNVFYTGFNALTGLSLPRNPVTARLMTRRYVAALLRHKEREIFLAGLWLTTGFDQHPHAVKKHSTSATTYTFHRKLNVLINSVTSFSNLPLIGIFYIGMTIFFLSFCYAAWLIMQRLFFAAPLSGWTSIVASIWLLGGMIISFVGIVGIYISKIYSETKRRPYSIVRQIHAQKFN